MKDFQARTIIELHHRLLGLLSPAIATPCRHAISASLCQARLESEIYGGFSLPEVFHQYQIAAGLIELRVENPLAVGRNGKCSGLLIDHGVFRKLPK